jgi:hypothetical protein
MKPEWLTEYSDEALEISYQREFLATAGTVFDCTHTGQCDRTGITYNKHLGRYLAWVSDWNGTDDFRNKGRGGFGIYESATPWDRSSWRTVWHTPCNACGWDIDGDGSTTGSVDDGIGDAGNFVTKWMSDDGREMYLAYGGTNSFSLRKAFFQTGGAPSTQTPSVSDRNIHTAPNLDLIPSVRWLLHGQRRYVHRGRVVYDSDREWLDDHR